MTRRPSRRERVARLLSLLQHATDFAEPFRYFEAKLATDKGLIRQSKPGEPGLDYILHVIADHLFEPGTPVICQRFLRFRRLWHGMCYIRSHPAVLLYHAAANIGILAVYTGYSTEYVRFSVVAKSPVIDQRKTDVRA